MKRIMSVFGLMIVVIAIMAVGTASASYTIDGCIKDWGVNLDDDWNLVKTWEPASSTCHWTVEDNKDPRYYSPNYHGIHVTGKGASYTDYKEPKIIMWEKGKFPASYSPPYHLCTWLARACELNDKEAGYYDANKTHSFVAIVTSVSPKVISDLAIDSDGNGYYDYGIVLNGKYRGKIYKNPKWSETDKFKGSGPYRITGGTVIGTADIAYKDTNIFDHGHTNWVIEISMPKLNITKLHVTLFCGNDVVEVIPTKPTPIPTPIITPIPTIAPTPIPPNEEIPEFSTIAIPVTAILGLLFFFNRRKKNNKN